ncbi:MAG: polysaccharide biosynthesis protein [Asgard group archaeon]|nr:polysaccharide biosynthesis protein [Asgard group archaeon]
MATETNVAIIGAGIAGELLLKELKTPRYGNYNVVGFIDDDVNKIGKKIKGILVLGSTNEILEIASQKNIQLFIIAIPSAKGEVIQRIVNVVRKTKVNFMIVPPIFQNLKINQISFPREVEINDLLRRPIENVLTEESMKKLKDSVVVITGVAGSIGSELCIQIASCFPKKIIGIDCAETPLFEIKNEIRSRFPNIDFTPILANIQDIEKIKSTLSFYKPQILYHCAAFKHVGMMELFPRECVANNIKGSLNIINTAIENHVDRFVFVSTDKAVNPTSIMGSSKRIIEKYLLSLPKNHTKFMIVRFGNVLESNGSAITIFNEQIKRGGPVTITDMKMDRYFMTITEAAQLVVQASILGEGGELFVLDMGEPYKIIDIINHLIELHGMDIKTMPIKIIGKQPGEKLSEELFYDFEEPEPTKHLRILSCKTTILEDKVSFKEKVEDFVNAFNKLEDNEIKRTLFNLAHSKS